MALYWDHIAAEYQSETQICLDDFHYGPLLPGDRELQLLPHPLHGLRALELGCGAGQNSIFLSSQGAVCSAVDISSEQIRHGQGLSEQAGVSIEFHALDMDADWLPCRGPYDLIHATYSLPFSSEPEQVIMKAWEHLVPGGHFLLTMGHPLYAGEWLEIDEEFGVFLPSYFEPRSDLRDLPDSEDRQIGARCYPLSAVFAWLRKAGFEVVRMEEPRASESTENLAYSSEDWLALQPVLTAIPLVVIFLCRKSDA
jgi:SAM-dependent methyltransferase